MIRFVRTFSIMLAQGLRLIAVEEFRNYGKIVYIKNYFENGWWEDAYSSFYPPGSALGHKLYTNHQKSLPYFSQLAPLTLFFFTKRQIEKGGHGTMPP